MTTRPANDNALLLQIFQRLEELANEQRITQRQVASLVAELRERKIRAAKRVETCRERALREAVAKHPPTPQEVARAVRMMASFRKP